MPSCVICGILKAASRAFRLNPFYILPLVDCSVSPLSALPGVHLPTPNQPRWVHQCSVADAVAAVVKDQRNLRWADVSPPLISSISKSIPCHLFNCWVIIAVHVITQRCRHRYDTGSSRSLMGGPFQTPDNASALSVSSGTSSSRKSRQSPKVVGQGHVHCLLGWGRPQCHAD